MGVPKFFRFVSERYPLLSTPLTPTVAPPLVDNLYLDMNGILHNCVRGTPGAGGPDSRRYASTAPPSKSRAQIFLDVFKYIDNLFALAPPRKLLYMAIDGVAPRAKMNQQRARRFRSAQERRDEHDRLLKEDPMYAAAGEEPFDSNCITPGTEFMQELTRVLQFFVARKVTEDRRWARVRVILSGPEAPGEGEHKIMEWIRACRESGPQNGASDANLRHCVYGLDADLIMLGLVTHEPHFYILREKVDYNQWRKKGGPRVATELDTTVFGQYELLSIGVLREYLALDLGADGNSALRYFDVEKIADDFVLTLMLIGNDFLPNLPTLDIADGTLNVMLHLYKRVLPLLGGYLVESGNIVPERLEYFFAKLAMLDKSVMRSKAEAEKQSSSGRGKRGGRNTAVQNVDLDQLFGFQQRQPNAALPRPYSRLELLREAAKLRGKVNDEELQGMKRRYYGLKFGANFVVDGDLGLRKLVQSYVEGVSWTLKYYTEGCRHWRWFYPYHYAPLASDISDVAAKLAAYEKRFVADRPFRPQEQLLSVLPPISAWCLPKPYRELMTSASSPIRDLYPEDFESDLNGKRNDWEAIVLLPFVDERRLLQAMASIPAKALTADERKRNELGPSYLYTYSAKHSEQMKSPFGAVLPSFESNARRVDLQLPRIPPGKPFTSRLLRGTLKPGTTPELALLPYLGSMKHTARLESAAVNVFGTPSRNQSVVLVMDFEEGRSGQREGIRGESVVGRRGLTVGSPVWFGYPWVKAGVVEAIATNAVTKRASLSVQGRIVGGVGVEVKETSKNAFARDAGIVKSTLYQKGGVVIPVPTEIVEVRVEAGSDGLDADDEGGGRLVLCDAHFVRRREAARAEASAGADDRGDLVVVGQKVLCVGHGPYFGHVATVRGVGKDNTVSIQFKVPSVAAREPAFGYRVVSISSSQRWMSVAKLAASLGLSVPTVDAFLGSVRVRLQSGKEEVDLGLGIKYIGRGLYIPGYGRREERGNYSFSEKAFNLLRQYRATFPHLFTTISSLRLEENKSTNGKRGPPVYSTRDLFGNTPKADSAAKAASTWLSLQEVAHLPLVSTGAQVLPKETVGELEKHGAIILSLQRDYIASLNPAKTSTALKQIARAYVLTGSEAPTSVPSSVPPESASTFRLGDRVVNRLAVGSVPFGLRGSVVGIHPPSTCLISSSAAPSSTTPTLIEVVFDTGFIGGSTLSGRCSRGRGKAVPASTVFKVRPERENAYYVKHYARVAAHKAGAQMRSETADTFGTAAAATRAAAIGKASVMSYAGAVGRKSIGGKVDTDVAPVLDVKRAGGRPDLAGSGMAVASGSAAWKVREEGGGGVEGKRLGGEPAQSSTTAARAARGEGEVPKKGEVPSKGEAPSKGGAVSRSETEMLMARLKRELGIVDGEGPEGVQLGGGLVGRRERLVRKVALNSAEEDGGGGGIGENEENGEEVRRLAKVDELDLVTGDGRANDEGSVKDAARVDEASGVQKAGEAQEVGEVREGGQGKGAERMKREAGAKKDGEEGVARDEFASMWEKLQGLSH